MRRTPIQGITAVDANMDQYLDLANDGPYGYGPDVLYQANDVIMQYAKGKHIYPLPVQQLSCYEQIPESAWKAYETTVDGTTYCCRCPGQCAGADAVLSGGSAAGGLAGKLG